MGLLSSLIFLPLAGALVLYAVPERARRAVALVASGGAFLLSLTLVASFTFDSGALQLEERVAWIPSLGASYHVGVDGLSLPLIALTTLLVLLVVIHARTENRTREYYALVLLLATGVLGTFAALDLLLFYLFFELSLVPMYFLIGVWGKERRVEAALKFFLYTRVGSLAMLLGFIALYLNVTPRTFDIPALIAAQPFPGAGAVPSLVLLGLFLGFAIKLPIVPLHSWLPDAHTEAPTGGSVLLAGLLLKLGGYGFLRIALPLVPGAMSAWALPLAILGALSAIYGTVVAMGQSDLKRLVAYSSINEMGYVLVGVAVAGAAWADPAARATAATGATYMMLAHGLSTGALFFLVGMLEKRTHEREIPELGGLWAVLPRWGTGTAFMTFAALGLPGLAVFVAELQIVFGTLAVFPWVAAAVILAIVLTTAMFLWMLQRTLLGAPRERWRALPELGRREIAVVATLGALLLVFGLWPGALSRSIELASRATIVRPLTTAR